jgi:hypothetical protein
MPTNKFDPGRRYIWIAICPKKIPVPTNYILAFSYCTYKEFFFWSQALQDWPGLPYGVKFDPTDQELIEHLQGKVAFDNSAAHPLIDEFIPTIGGEDGICYTHPEKLPGVYCSQRYRLANLFFLI